MPDMTESLSRYDVTDTGYCDKRNASYCHPHCNVSLTGLVPDEYLDGLSTETTITAAELCTAGMWERVDGGYRVLDWEAVEVCLDRVRKKRGEDPQALAWEREREAKVRA